MTIFCLDRSSVGRVCDFLDKCSMGCFRLTCRDFYSVAKANENYRSIVKIILDNYDIVASSESDLKKMFLSNAPCLVGLGEQHDSKIQRFMNAHVVHMLWNRNYYKSQVWTEGSKSSLENCKKNGVGQLRYLNEEMVSSAKSWDLKDKKLSAIEESANHAIRTVKLIKQIFVLFSDFEKFDCDLFKQFIENRFEESLAKNIYNTIPEIEELTKTSEPKETEQKTLIIYQKFLCFVIDLFVSNFKFFNDKSDKLHEQRDSHLAFKVKLAIQHAYRNLFLLAGRAHIMNPEILSKAKSAYKKAICKAARKKLLFKNTGHYLFLCPKESMTAQVIQELPFRYFNFQAESSEMAESNQEYKETPLQVLKRKFGSLAIHNSFDTIDLQSKEWEDARKLFLEADLDTIDCYDNHFAFWAGLSLLLLGLELKKTQLRLEGSGS